MEQLSQTWLLWEFPIDLKQLNMYCKRFWGVKIQIGDGDCRTSDHPSLSQLKLRGKERLWGILSLGFALNALAIKNASSSVESHDGWSAACFSVPSELEEKTERERNNRHMNQSFILIYPKSSVSLFGFSLWIEIKRRCTREEVEEERKK